MTKPDHSDIHVNYDDDVLRPRDPEQTPWELVPAEADPDDPAATVYTWEIMLHAPDLEARPRAFSDYESFVEWVKIRGQKTRFGPYADQLRPRPGDAVLPDESQRERDTAEARAKVRTLTEKLGRLAAAKGLALDSEELFLIASGQRGDADRIFESLILYDNYGCQGNATPISGYCANLAAISQPAKSCRSSGHSVLYNQMYGKTMGGQTLVLDGTNVQRDTLPFTPAAAETW